MPKVKIAQKPEALENIDTTIETEESKRQSISLVGQDKEDLKWLSQRLATTDNGAIRAALHFTRDILSDIDPNNGDKLMIKRANGEIETIRFIRL